VFDVEDANVVGGGHDRPVIRVRHKFDREDVAAMARHYGRSEAELRRRRFGMV
jgi:hypothetical protein